ncbi:flavin reductase family protein [Streptomyces sp. NPDC085524]|uniref:flavin reductase family protein n=1 Tax=unclassified Streptomyces TaxID=2593676 RepID=UPI0035D86524
MTESALRTPPSATADEFRTMMSGFPTGVGIITATDDDGAQRGMTCSSVCSVSLDPPVLLVNLRHGSPTLDAVLQSGAFAVNLLHAGGRRAAELFASGNPDRFGLVRWAADEDAAGAHLVQDAHTIADCEVVLTQRMGDHVTVYGEARRIVRRAEQEPLLYGLRQFRDWPAA